MGTWPFNHSLAVSIPGVPNSDKRHEEQCAAEKKPFAYALKIFVFRRGASAFR
jgi:hypothetical protein